MYNKQFWDDVWEQVGMMTKAGYISAATSILISTLFTNLATAWVGLIAAGVFALVYWIDSMNAQEAKRREQQNLISSQTFHSLDSEKDQPNNMNQKALNGRLWEHYGGHPSAKYTLVTTGEVNPQFTGKIIVSPPNNLRIATDADLADEFNLEFFGLQETYDTMIEEGMTEEEIQDMMPEFKMFNYIRQSYLNLDFLLISSELPSYNSIEYYYFEYGTEDYRTDTYNKHQGFTLGFLEQSIISASKGEYDAVRPMCINGRPAYMYINTNDDLSQLTQPLSPLYQPVVISNERYGELFPDSAIPDSTISIDVQSTLLEEPYTFGINASDLIYYELERGYKAKIPLYSDEFNYPISMITVEVITSDVSSDLLSSTYFATYVSEIELTSSQYTLEGGNLYFYNTFDEIVLLAFNYKVLKDEFIELTQNWEEGTLSYRVNIYFPQVIGDTSTTSGIIDTVSSDVGRNALAQTTQFLISDYFNAFTLAESFALAQAEIDYIAKITTVSTLISSLFLAPAVIASAGASVLSKGIEKVAQNTLTTTLSKEVLKNVGVNIIKYIASMPIQVLTEVFEELYIDSLIEETFANWGDSNGFWASLVCSIREVVFGAPSAFISGLKSNSQSNTQTSTSSLLHGYDMIQDHSLDFGLSQSQQQAFMDTQTSKIDIHSLAEKIPTIFQGIMSLPGFFFGGFGLGFIGMAFDLTIDNMFDVQLARYLGEKEVQRLIQQQAPLDLNYKLSALEFNARTISTIPQVKNVLAMAKGIATINPSQYSASEFTAQVQLRMNALEELGTYIQTMKERQENLKENHKKITLIKEMVNSEFESNENPFEIFVAEAAEQADPVYEVNGMRIWIQPLPADRYNLDHDMTLNEFLDLIGILNDPSKQAIYYNPISGATYILNIFDGNMPFIDVLDLIGYDRNNLEQQFLGNAHRIKIIDTTTLLQLQDDTKALFHPDVREEIFYRHGVTDYQRSYFSKKILDAYSIVKLRFQDTFRETIYESAYNIIKTRYSEDFGITQDEWLELVGSKAKDEHGAFTQEFEKIVDLCLKEQVFLNLIELSGAQDQDVDAIFSTLDAYLDENFGSLIEQLFAPLTFEAFISEVINQVLINIDNEGFVSFDVATHEYFEDLISVQDSYKAELVSVYWGSPPPPEFKSRISIEREFNTELDALNSLFYRIKEYLSDQNINTLPITDELVNLLGPDDSKTYTIEYLKDLLQALGIDNEFLLGWFSDQKTFYKVLLDHIHQASTNPNIDQELRATFEQIVERIGNEEFTDNRRFTDNDEDLLRILDEALNNLFGYVGYVLLQLGLIKFDDSNNNLKFELPENLDVLKDRIIKFGINSIVELSPSWTSDTITEYFMYSILFSGHYKKITKINDLEQFQSSSKIHTYPGSQFFTGIFNNFMGNIPDSIYHLSMIWNFMNSEMMETRNRIRETIRIFNDQGVDYWFGRMHQDLISLIFTEVAEGMPSSYIEKLKVVSVATIITPDGNVKHIVAINGDTRNQQDPPWKISNFLENAFGSDEIIIAYTPQDQNRLFEAPELDFYSRKNHAEVKVLELLRSLNIAPNSRIYLSASLQTCITCRLTAWQYEILSELKKDSITVEIYQGEGQDLLDKYSIEFSERISTREDFFNEYRPFFERLLRLYPHFEININAELLSLWNRYNEYVRENINT